MNWNIDWEWRGPSWIMSSLRQPFVSGVVDSCRSLKRVLYSSLAIFPIRCYQLDSNLANLQDTVEVGSILELLYLTTQLQHVRDEHFKFHKVVQRHYSGEVENVYMTLRQIYSGNYVPSFITIARVLWEILQKKHFGLFFLGHSVIFILNVVRKSVLGNYYAY